VRTAFALALATAALAAAPAHAGTYDVWSCRLPDGKVAPLDGWRYEGAGPRANQCPHFGFSAGFSSTGVPAGATAGWWFEVPQHLSIASYELYRSARTGLGSDGTGRAYALFHDVPEFEPLVHMFEFCAPFAISHCRQQGVPYPADPMSAANRVVRSGLHARRLILRMECRSYDGAIRACGPADHGGALGIARARITLSESLPPELDAPTGPLMEPAAMLEGVQSAAVSARDSGGGLERLAVVVDGNIAMEEPLVDVAPGCRSPYVKVVPCARSVTRTLAFDTTSVPNGPHSVQIAAYDAAGNRTLSPAVPVTILNGSLPNGIGATRQAQVVARIAGRKRSAAGQRATLDFGARRTIQGRVTDAGGDPIARARLDVTGQARRRGAPLRREGTVTTDAQGRFRFRARRGPSRILRVGYRAFTLDPAPSAVASVTLNVRAGIRLNVTPSRITSRGTIRFRGRLLGGPGRERVQVTLYAVGRVGRQRVPVSVLRTDRKGRFRFSYQFQRTFAPFTYRFQARVERQPTYPYAAAGSNRVVVRVVR
jgi:hypothetical protein